ncbi:hypothetical protein EYF80_017400 [Liparis tanakae]|uniref:Uncharacterized protein n=1 Tax=Liparis tanakae TaxID=230148 RepID=A0A4Z2I3M6_9TELE|nr:hypothetical protein EYF80_017400 [Liparis tanakae]
MPVRQQLGKQESSQPKSEAFLAMGGRMMPEPSTLRFSPLAFTSIQAERLIDPYPPTSISSHPPHQLLHAHLTCSTSPHPSLTI